MRTAIGLLAVLLLAASTAHAQSPEHAPAKLKIAYSAFAASELLDSASTHLADIGKRLPAVKNDHYDGCKAAQKLERLDALWNIHLTPLACMA